MRGRLQKGGRGDCGGRGESGLDLKVSTTASTVGKGRLTVKASVINNTSEAVDDVKLAFATPPGFAMTSTTCSSRSEEGAILICNEPGAIFANKKSKQVSVQYESRTSGGGIAFGAVAILHSGAFGNVVDYTVEAGSQSLQATNLRDLAR